MLPNGRTRRIMASAIALVALLTSGHATAAGEPTLELTASKTSVLIGKAVQLAWTATNVDYCVAADGWSGRKAASGTYWTGPLESKTRYKLTCYGSTSITRSVVVNVRVPSLTLTATPGSIGSGESATLAWNGAYVWNCTASGSWSGSRPASGSEVRSQLTQSETYTLSCSSGIGAIIAMTSVAVSSGSARISWQPPTENVDDSPLTDLSHYRIYVGTVSRSYYRQIDVFDPSATTYDVGLGPGEYYIAMTAIDADGMESALSNEVRRVIP